MNGHIKKHSSLKEKILIFIHHYWPVLVFILVYLIIFKNVFFSHLVPYPGNLLATWFFPYNAGGWAGYIPWTTHKQFILADVIRQLYPWRILAMDLIKNGTLPLWNNYAFAGNPLIANLQAAVFYPLNILFFIFQPQWAWIIYIMIQPILETFFMYLFIRSIGLSRLAALFAGIGFAFLGYLDVRFEMGITGHTALWLPFILWGMTKFMDTKKALFLVLSAIGITCSILSGYIQTTAYVLIFSFAYFIYIGWDKITKPQLVKGLLILSLGIALSGIQIVPTYELLTHSVVNKTTSAAAFYEFITPPSYIAMLFAPDFFGNPAVNNFWGKNYGEFMSYSGIVVLLVATIGFFTQLKNKIVRLSLFIAIIAYLVAFVPFVADLLFRSPIPLLNSEPPSRTIFFASFGFVLTSAFGIESIQMMKLKKLIPPVLFFSIYIVLWIIVYTMHIDPAKLNVTKHNIILPTAIAFLVGFAIIARKYTKHAFILWIIIFSCMTLEYSYFLNKYLPWSPMQYIYPAHPLITKLQLIVGDNRVYGYDKASLGTNLFVKWRLQSPEGYDPLYIKNYGELIYAGKTGKLEADVPKADANLPSSLPNQDSYRKQVLMNLLGVRYVVDREDSVPKKWDPQPLLFSPIRFTLLDQWYKWKIYENKMALPRAVVFYNYAVIPQKATAIKTIFNPKFPYRQKLVLSQAPAFKPNSSPVTPAKITKYSADDVSMTTDTKKTGLLFLSDNYYPGWQATVDKQSVPIIKADYSFCAVEVPAGKHTITFSYRPMSLYIGAFITFITAIVFGIIARKKVT